MGRITERNLPFRHDPACRGIFVQKSDGKKFCITFPRLSNLSRGDEFNSGEVIFPTGDFKTFSKALDFALQVREIDSRLSECKIYLCTQKWIGSSGHRVTQLIA
jgi:hypothetical protein